MADPITTEQQPDLPTLDQLPANEYRAVREGKTVADVVAARPAVEEAPAAADPSPDLKGQPARDEGGRFVPKAAGEPKADAPVASKAGNPRHDPRARIDELTKEKADAVRRAEAAEADRERYRLEVDAYKRGEGPKPDAVAVKTEPSTPGKIEYPAELKSYEAYAEKNADATYEDFTDARGDFRLEQRDKLRQQADFEQTARAEYETQLKPFKERETAFKAKTADYDAVIQRSPVAQMPLPPWVIEEIRTSEHGPALRYYLVQHPDETAWMAAQPKAAAVSFLKGLFTAAPVASTVTTAVEPTTKADPPFETVGASAAASTHSLETVAAKGSAGDYRRLREGGVRQ